MLPGIAWAGKLVLSARAEREEGTGPAGDAVNGLSRALQGSRLSPDTG